MPFFKNVFHSKDKQKPAKPAPEPVAPPKPRWEESWTRKDVAPEEIQELVHVCTQEMKSRALDMPFMLLPFRPTSDTSASRNFVRNFFKAAYEGTRQYSGEGLAQELRLTEPLTLCSIIKWCWSRLPGGVVTWDAYELFRIGESDSNFARHAFDTFIPISVDSEARKHIIFDFFDLLSAVAARGKTNGMGGRKLSRLAGWWAFEFVEDGKGFDGGYRTWEKAADAASHLFFAYLRSLSPDLNVVGGISALPRSLQALLSQTEYPPQTPSLMQTRTTKVIMIVDSVSPTPFALLRRAKHFEYRDDDRALQQFSAYDDTVKALTDECHRVLKCIANANQSIMSPVSPDPKTPDPSWSRFEDFGFSGILDSPASTNGTSLGGSPNDFSSLRSGARSKNTDFGRPTTPSWADFLSSGFADENNQAPPNMLMPPSQKLPPLGENRVHSSQSHMRNGLNEDDLEPGELASITQFDLDETFWWVWMTSLASEETTDRKAAFGRCTLIETRIHGAKWLVMEEQVKGASPGPEEGAYIAEKKSKFSFTRRGRLGRRKSTGKKPPVKEPYNRTTNDSPMSKTSIGPDQHARIQAAAAKLAQNERNKKDALEFAQRRGRTDDVSSVKTNSVLTLQPHLVNEAGPAMQWDKKFGEAALDRDTLRAQYLGDVTAGRGSKSNLVTAANGRSSPLPPELSNRDLPALPKSVMEAPSTKRADSRSPARIETNTPVEASVAPVPWPNDSPTHTPLPHEQSFPKPLHQEQTFTAPVHQEQSHPTPPHQEQSFATPREETPFATQVSVPIAEDKALPSVVTPNQHPALRKPLPERKPVVASQPNIRVSEDQTSAPAKKPSPNKLKKKEGGGFRRMFGRKKTETPAPAPVAVPAPVEAVRPTEPEDNSYFQASDAVRSTSRLEDHPAHVREPSPTYSDEQPEPLRAPSPKYEPSPAASSFDAPEPLHAGAPAPGSAATQQEIDRAFSRFDQGPMDDMPAFAPADDDSDDDAAISPIVPRRQQPPFAQQQNPRTPTQRVPQYSDDISEESVEFAKQASPSQDRWAQIRKNAAERAARLSEEQTRRSRSQSQSQRTDEGETSGEETIESRVARIKARVAELTSNIDGQPAGPGPGAGRQW
ncbi:hypothetical protein BDW02DRAFT_577081 [Decorospora gaudefroyi]|uniref:Meiotically up-regulated protein Msb1/Mug8 domain-containing protein n=1 Tax=Decorospora gaudefroyi TaxID=184978 RepID=A0A6A5KP54_9PLEO|nr:hypothetical protein BDW02DRAFT_577081 [Decorospora gaudefroyi]